MVKYLGVVAGATDVCENCGCWPCDEVGGNDGTGAGTGVCVGGFNKA